MTLLRTALINLDNSQKVMRESIIDDMLDYYNRQNDHTQIKENIKNRYGVRIVKETDPNSASVSTETFTRSVKNEGFVAQVDAGLVEALSFGFANKISDALGTLFTESGQKFSLIHETMEDIQDQEEIVQRYRDDGGLTAALTICDQQSVKLGSSAVYISFSGNQLNYQVLSPSDLRTFFAETIEEDGVVRATDVTDIEDATAITIRLSQVDFNTWNYLAIYGRSDIWPEGRWVTFQSSNLDVQVPEPGTEGAVDFEIKGTVANPLSYWANRNTDISVPEYPLAIIYSGLTDTSDVMPYYTSLYADSLEFDLSASHLLSTSQDASRGLTIVQRSPEAMGQPLPRIYTGVTASNPGQTIEHIDFDSIASVNGIQVMQQLMIDYGAAYGVPDFMVTSEDHTVEASSGIALEVKSRPLKKKRNLRIEINRPSVRKVYEIERSFISLFGEEQESDKRILMESWQAWEPGPFEIPQNKKEQTERIISELNAGLIDIIEAIREKYMFGSDTEAIAMYEKMQERQEQFPPLNQAPEESIPVEEEGEFE